MEELKVLANSYAEENVINVLKESFAKVYADGYRDGYKDREEEIPVDLRDNKTEYVDLGLPSGTLWATDFEKEEGNRMYLPYGKAALLNIPTIEQWDELYKSCRWECVTPNRSQTDSTICEVLCVGPNGNVLKFERTGMYEITDNISDGYEIYFWLIDNEEESEKNSVVFRRILNRRINNIDYYETAYKTNKLFSGFKLPIRLVRKK